MTDGSLLSPRESAGRALSIITATVGNEDIDLKMILQLAGDDPRELLEVMAALAHITSSVLECAYDDPLAPIKALGLALDELTN